MNKKENEVSDWDRILSTRFSFSLFSFWIYAYYCLIMFLYDPEKEKNIYGQSEVIVIIQPVHQHPLFPTMEKKKY